MVGCNLDARTEPSDSHIVFTMSILPVKWSSCIYLHFKTLQKKFVRDASVTSSNLKNHIECKCKGSLQIKPVEKFGLLS